MGKSRLGAAKRKAGMRAMRKLPVVPICRRTHTHFRFTEIELTSTQISGLIGASRRGKRSVCASSRNVRRDAMDESDVVRCAAYLSDGKGVWARRLASGRF